MRVAIEDGAREGRVGGRTVQSGVNGAMLQAVYESGFDAEVREARGAREIAVRVAGGCFLECGQRCRPRDAMRTWA